MGNRIILTQEQIDSLSKLPEQGMGYQIVDVILMNGEVLSERVVFNSTYLKLNESDNFTVNNIKQIVLHNK